MVKATSSRECVTTFQPKIRPLSQDWLLHHLSSRVFKFIYIDIWVIKYIWSGVLEKCLYTRIQVVDWTAENTVLSERCIHRDFYTYADVEKFCTELKYGRLEVLWACVSGITIHREKR